MNTKYIISTDSITTTIEACTADEAACKFAASENIGGITTAKELIALYASRDGWCKINEA